MLRKLLKYEMLSTSRAFGVSYVGMLAAAVLVRIFVEVAYWQDQVMPENVFFPLADIIAGLSAFLYFGMIVVVFVITLILILQRFYKNLLTGEGYLMHTLPVTTHQLILSKLIAAVIWSVLSTIIVCLSVLILAFTPEFIGAIFSAIGLAIQDFQEIFHFPLVIYGLEWVVVLLVAAAGSILQIYAAIMLGHQAPKYRVALAVVAYFVINMILSFVFTFLMVGIAFLPESVWAALGAFFSGMSPLGAAQVLVLGTLLFNAVFVAIFYPITAYLMHRRLNLE